MDKTLRGEMNNIRHMMQERSAKSLEILSKLLDTSDGALKTRDRLLSELKQELQHMMVLEGQHLFPVLRKHKDLKGLVDDTLRDNKETKSLLADLERTPRDSEEFGKKVAILRKTFQQHVRDEKKELLPAIAKALSDEEAASVVETMDDSRTKLEETRHAEAEQRRADARKDRGPAERSVAGRNETVQQSGERVVQVFGRSMEEGGEVTKRASDDLRALSQASEAFGRGVQSISREWFELSQNRVQQSLDDMTAVFRSRTLPDMLAAQSAMVRHNFEMMAENTQRIMSMSVRMTNTVKRPLDRAQAR